MWEHCANLFLSFCLLGSEPEHQESWYQLKSYEIPWLQCRDKVCVACSVLHVLCLSLVVSCASIGSRKRGILHQTGQMSFPLSTSPMSIQLINHHLCPKDFDPQCIRFIFCQVLLIYLYCQLHFLVLLIPHFPLCTLVLLPQALKGSSWAPVTCKTLAHNCRAPSFRYPETS